MPLPLLSFLVAPLVFLAAKRAAEKAQQEANAPTYEQQDEFVRLLEEAAKADPHDLEKQEAYSMALMALAMEREEKRPPTPRDALQDEFHAARERGDWVAAETALRHLLALEDSPMQHYRDWGRLGDILQKQGRNDEAYEAIQAATRCAREADLSPLITTALQAEAVWAAKQGDRAHAYACLDEGLQSLEKTDMKQDWHEARFRIQRAQLLLEDGEQDRATAEITTTEPVLKPYANSMMLTGPLSTLQGWWQVTALLRLAQGNSEGAKTAGQEALWIARRIAEFPQLAEYDRREGLRRSLERYAELQEKLGNADAAASARQEASTLAP